MPSPFPGMDPFLEHPGLWPDVHTRFITIAGEFLGAQLRPKYFARIEERVYVSDDNDSGRSVLVPDVKISMNSGWESRPFEVNSGGLEPAEPFFAATMVLDDIHEVRVEIIDRESRTVVTVIELLSPSNKVAGSAGRSSFDAKRKAVAKSTTHWVEIDLLRGGLGFLNVPGMPPCEYTVHVSRAERRMRAAIWPIRLSQRLPVVPIPLKAGDDDAKLDLQAVLATVYDRAGYDMQLDYRREPVPPLPPEWAAWADALLKEKGLRAS